RPLVGECGPVDTSRDRGGVASLDPRLGPELDEQPLPERIPHPGLRPRPGPRESDQGELLAATAKVDFVELVGGDGGLRCRLVHARALRSQILLMILLRSLS